jgi:hypothetical protein
MICPNKKCGRETGRLNVKVDEHGNVYEGCPACLPISGATPNVRSGRKIWAGSQCYTKSQIEQKNYDWIERTAERAANMRRRSPLRTRGPR